MKQARIKQALLDRVIRVDHAGEYGARVIYEGQLAVLGDREGAAKIQEMYDQEKHHYDVMEKMVLKHRVRPTLLTPLWHVGGFALGAVTALMGKEAAMACTVAVETEIAQHYNDQLRELIKEAPEETELAETISAFRDDELHHLDVGLDEGAKNAPAYDLLEKAIRGITRTAIRVAERV